MFFCFVTKHACDGRTEKRNYDPQDRAVKLIAFRFMDKMFTLVNTFAVCKLLYF